LAILFQRRQLGKYLTLRHLGKGAFGNVSACEENFDFQKGTPRKFKTMFSRNYKI
jgi:hypothetical protein